MKFLKIGVRACIGNEIRGWVKKEGSHIAATLIPDDVRECIHNK